MNSCKHINDQGFQCLLWKDHQGKHDWDTAGNPLKHLIPVRTLAFRIMVKDFVTSGYSAEVDVFDPDGTTKVTYYVSRIPITIEDAPKTLTSVVSGIIKSLEDY